MSESLSVLIIDSETAIHGFVREAMQSLCPQPFVSTNGSDGIQLARTNQPDVVLIDLDLPEEDGYQVVGDLRRDTKAQIIVASKRWGKSDRRQALFAGADDFILKPFFIEELIDRIESGMKPRPLGRAA